MMVVADETLTAELQALVDARLDTIDRMLLGRVPRGDRAAITREVEAQIHDLLAERAGAEVDRDLVLSVLGRLDPPEAYLTDDPTGGPATILRTSSPRPLLIPRDHPSRAGHASGIVGLAAIGLDILGLMLLAVAYLAAMEEAVYGFLGITGLAFIVGIVALSLSCFARVANNWAIVGLTTGLISLIVSPLSILFFFLIA